MRSRFVASLLLLIALASSSKANQSASMRDVHPEDANVLREVLDRLILPALAQLGNEPAPRLFVEEQTTARATGKIPDWWLEILRPNPTRGWTGLIPDDARRQRVIASFESRNARPHKLPDLGPARIAKERVAGVRRQYRDRPLVIAHFSLPGYSPDGWAMVVASYDCGDLCGASWLIILDKTTGSWRFAKSHPLSIS